MSKFEFDEPRCACCGCGILKGEIYFNFESLAPDMLICERCMERSEEVMDH